MKKRMFSLFMGLLLTLPVCLAQSTSVDEEAIKKVIIEQTNAFFAKNHDKWASSWVHEPYVSWTAQGGADRVMTVSGWQAYSRMFEGYFNDPTPPLVTTFLHENLQVTVLDKVATVTYLQTRQRASGNLKSREARILEKQGNDWKLVSVYSRNIE